MSYDPSNVFARILRGELPCKKVFEDEHVLAFEDIRPLAPSHVLVIPKGAYVSFQDFSEKASDAEINAFVRAAGKIARERGLDATGHRILANHGANGRQEVPHFHLHLFGGRDLGRMLPQAKE
ncbi:MAG: histidine triad nucleotide-binding protein [Alphaproteobacteria bacterium]